MIRRPPRSTRTYTLLPYTTLFRSPLKAAEDFRLIGKSVHRLDTPVKVNGSATYGIDVMAGKVPVAVPIACPEIGRAHVELQSLMRISYAVFCLQKNKTTMTDTILLYQQMERIDKAYNKRAEP